MAKKLANGQARAWLVVAAVGLLVILVVLVLGLFGRLGAGQDVLDQARPAFTEERVAGDRAAITMVSSIVDLAIRSPRSGAGPRPRCPSSWPSSRSRPGCPNHRSWPR